MKRNYYIFSAGKLIRKQDTIYFEEGKSADPVEENGSPDEDTIETTDEDAPEAEETDEPVKLARKPIPVNDVESIYCFAEMRFNTKFLNFIAKNQITLHLFNYYGYYTGSFYPREPFISGKLLVEQVSCYTDKIKRTAIAKKFVEGSADNILKTLQYYDNRGRDMSPFIGRIGELISNIAYAEEIDELMGIEGNIRSLYYESWHLIFNDPVEFERREKHPPTNPVNALISFGNSLVYTSVLSEIYKTQLNPLISFLHEPGERRFSLSLDIAEIFKPLLADRVIFSLINKKMITEKDFDRELNYCYLTEAGRKTFLKEFDEKLKTTIQHRTLKKQVSYRHLIRLECYKLIKHILGDKEYQPFRIWW
ncbi:MAG: type I-B CRISPR-associated endonuclease Cas1 [Ignavibacteriaceae bacterium]|nr:type I-B CRISPR-associated endonuclease Cas1 [Ignavibacteriaceae bacterium]